MVAARAGRVRRSRAWAAAARGSGDRSAGEENATVKVSDHVHLIPDFGVRGVPNVSIIVGTKATLVARVVYAEAR